MTTCPGLTPVDEGSQEKCNNEAESLDTRLNLALNFDTLSLLFAFSTALLTHDHNDDGGVKKHRNGRDGGMFWFSLARNFSHPSAGND